MNESDAIQIGSMVVLDHPCFKRPFTGKVVDFTTRGVKVVNSTEKDPAYNDVCFWRIEHLRLAG